MTNTYLAFTNFASTYGTPIAPTYELITLGMLKDGRILQGGLSALHIILTKFMLISLTQLDTEGTQYKADSIWKAAVARTNGRLSAIHTLLHRLSISQDAIDKQPIPLTSFNLAIAPLAELIYEEDQTCVLVTSAQWSRLLTSLDIPEPSAYVED